MNNRNSNYWMAFCIKKNLDYSLQKESVQINKIMRHKKYLNSPQFSKTNVGSTGMARNSPIICGKVTVIRYDIKWKRTRQLNFNQNLIFRSGYISSSKSLATTYLQSRIEDIHLRCKAAHKCLNVPESIWQIGREKWQRWVITVSSLLLPSCESPLPSKGNRDKKKNAVLASLHWKYVDVKN